MSLTRKQRGGVAFVTRWHPAPSSGTDPARGIINGLIISALCWAAIAALWAQAGMPRPW